MDDLSKIWAIILSLKLFGEKRILLVFKQNMDIHTLQKWHPDLYLSDLVQ